MNALNNNKRYGNTIGYFEYVIYNIKLCVVLFLVCITMGDVYAKAKTPNVNSRNKSGTPKLLWTDNSTYEEVEKADEEERKREWARLDMEDYRKEEAADKSRKETAAKEYNRLVSQYLELSFNDSNLTFREIVERLDLKVIEVENITEANILAKKYVSEGEDYIDKQIDTINELSLYKISTTFPYHINDSKYKKLKTKTSTWSYISIKKKTYILDYPDIGVSTKRNFLYVRNSKGDIAEEIRFEKGGIIFVEKGMDYDFKVEQLRCMSLSFVTPSDVIKNAITKHNKKIAEGEKKMKEKYGMEENDDKAKDAKQTKKSSSSTTGSTQTKANSSSSKK